MVLARLLVILIFAMFTWAGFPCLTHADPTAEQGRKIFYKYHDAIIKVKLTITFKLLMNGNEMKNKETSSETTGTVIDPSGLTLISLNRTNPGRLAEKSLRRNKKAKMDVESQLSNISLMFSDGLETPGEIVLRDRDLDMAFVRPSKKQDAPLPFLPQGNLATPEILDQVVVLSRLGKIAGRTPSVAIDRIQAVLKKPRTFYLPFFSRDLGSSVFTMDGKWIGVLLLRSVETRAATMAMVVILPASDIISAMGQVPKFAAQTD